MPISEFKIASRLYFSQQGEERHSRPAIRVALAGIIVGVMVMILTICIVVGFKQTVTQQVAGFGAFEVKERAARTGINPYTKKAMQIEASKSLSFKAGKAMKELLNK